MVIMPPDGVLNWSERVLGEVNKVFVGQRKLVRGVLASLLAEGHVLIESVPGLGKTLLVRVLGRVLGCAFNRIQFTPDLMPSDVTGSPIYDERINDFRFRPGPVFTQLLLADEINRAPAKTHSALLEIMQENRVTVDGVSYPIEPPFLVMATQNPIESEGTYNLPEAQLDRFLFKLVVEYPTAGEETDILRLHTRGFGADRGVADQLAVVTSPAEVREMQKRAESVLVEDHLLAYIAALVRKTRQWPTLVAGGLASRRRGDPARGAGRRGPGGSLVRLARRRSRRGSAGLAASGHAHARGRDRGTIRRRIAHRAHPVGRGSPAMKMIWPGRALGVALMAPALAVAGAVRDRVGLAARAGARRGGRHWWRSIDLVTLAGSGRLRVERHVGRVCSLDEPQDVELVIENPGHGARSMRLRDDVPDEFSAEPAAFEFSVPGRRQAILAYRFVPKRRGTYVFEQVDALVASRLGFWRGQYRWPLRTEVRVYPTFTRSRGSRCWRGATG